MNCHCGSNLAFTDCCEPFLRGDKLPETAEKLMRSRYSAYVQADLPYIEKTMAPEALRGFNPAEVLKSAKEAKWLGLEILSTERGGDGDSTGEVEFVARYEHGGEKFEHRELSHFRRGDGQQWLFVRGKAETTRESLAAGKPVARAEPKTGRNDPCPCGSGKKFKKCCG
jgi:SEC-C motif-containing protein